MIKVSALLLFFLSGFILQSCSTTVKGPVTRQEYNLEVGGAKDMADYRKEREAVVTKPGDQTGSAKDNCGFDQPDCSVVRQQPAVD
ncbi:MAG: hypothetical protein OQL09_05665 [Gammaproteobacteria bacterium]|nr:hypothetical protein [Gammaproteobacteria bacterium]